MTFEEALEVVQGLPGRMIDAYVYVPDDGERLHVASLSGVVDRVHRASASQSERYYVILKDHGAASWNAVLLDRRAYEGCEVQGSGGTFEEAVAEGDASGSTWEITLRHLGATTEILIYV